MFQNQGNWSLRHPFSKLSLRIDFENTWGSLLGFGIFILIWILSLVPCPMFRILALCLDFEGAKNIQVLQVLIWGIWRHCRFLTGVWHLYLDLDLVPGLWYTDDPNFGSIFVLKVQRTSMSFKSLFGALGILILILIWSLVFDTPMI